MLAMMERLKCVDHRKTDYLVVGATVGLTCGFFVWSLMLTMRYIQDRHFPRVSSVSLNYQGIRNDK